MKYIVFEGIYLDTFSKRNIASRKENSLLNRVHFVRGHITFKKMCLFKENIYLFKRIGSFKVEYTFKREKASFEKNLFLLKRTYCFQAEIHSFLKRIYSFKENILILKTIYTSFLDNTFLVEKVLRYIPLKTMYLFQDNRTFLSRVFTFSK